MSNQQQSGFIEQTIGEWLALAVALLGALAVACGVYETAVTLLGGGVFTLVSAVSLGEIWQGVRGRKGETFLVLLAGPFIWTAAVWVLFRTLLFYSPHAILIPAMFIAWIAARYPSKIVVPVFLLVFVMEGGLLFFGFQTVMDFSLNLTSYCTVAIGLVFFASSKVYREGVRKAVIRTKRTSEQHEYAQDLGFSEAPGPMQGVVSDLRTLAQPEGESVPVVDMVNEAFSLQLGILRSALNLSSVVLLWPDPEQKEYRLRSVATFRKDIESGPFPVGAGITGALVAAKDEIILGPVPGSYPPLPYYKRHGEVGGIVVFRIPVENEPSFSVEGKRVSPLLCADRLADKSWTNDELEAFRLTTRKIAADVRIGRQLLTMSQERSAIHLLCLGMHELNGALGLEQVLSATVRAVKRLADADFVAISLVTGNNHRIGAVAGDRSERLRGMEFPLEEGLAGQALKIRRSLPAKAQCHGPAQVFGEGHKLTGYRSLLVIPLLKGEGGDGVGSLTVASRKKGVFDRSRQDILELIAAQVAIKIDLGQAHEQISKLATTDGLTGLANHRTFQHGFDVMLQRAERRKGALCMVLCDIDHFKKVNDAYGHPFGDKVLQGVAEVLLKAVRSLDLAARYGGEEFAIVLEDADEKGGCLMAERIRKEIERKIFLHERQPVQVTVSLGLAVYPAHGREKAMLISRADQALYRAKQQGRNRLVCWEN